MVDFLRDYAINNIWSVPGQDHRQIIKPVYVDEINGSHSALVMGWEHSTLPTPERYTVYTFGYHPKPLWGYAGDLTEWVKVSDLCTTVNMQLDIYDDTGLQLPRFESYVKILDNKTLVMAIKGSFQPHYSLYTAFYRNTFFSSSRFTSRPGLTGIRCDGCRVDLNDPIAVNMVNEIAILKNDGRHVTAFRNGFYVSDIRANTLVNGEWIEYILDDSVYVTEELKVTELKSFLSDRFNQHRYLVQLADRRKAIYKDDFDIYVVDETSSDRPARLYYRNTIESVALLTHSAFSVDVSAVAALVPDVSEASLRIVCKNSGLVRERQFSSHKINELYKFPVEDITNLMGEHLSLPSYWMPHILEQTGPTDLMGGDPLTWTTEELKEYYGYNAISHYYADNPVTVRNDGVQNYVRVSPAYQGHTAYAHGNLGVTDLGNVGTKDVIPAPDDAVIVEFIPGTGIAEEPGWINVSRVPYSGGRYRLYRRIGVSQNWTDVTDEHSWSLDVGENGTELVCVDMNPLYDYVIRTNDQHYRYSGEIVPNRGIIELPIPGKDNTTVEVPFANISVRLNGLELIQGLDFTLDGVVITVTNYEVIQETNTIEVVAYGFPDTIGDQVVWGADTEWGWVTDGTISRDTLFQIRDDAVYSCIYEYNRVSRYSLTFNEDDYTVKGDLRNGAFYALKRTYPSLEALGIGKDEEDIMRSVSALRDKEVSGFLTANVPPPPISDISPITRTRSMYSPLTARLIYDLSTGIKVVEEGRYDDSELTLMFGEYETLANRDIIKANPGQVLQHGLVSFRPHIDETVRLSVFHYSLVERLSKLLLGSTVDLSYHVSILK